MARVDVRGRLEPDRLAGPIKQDATLAWFERADQVERVSHSREAAQAPVQHELPANLPILVLWKEPGGLADRGKRRGAIAAVWQVNGPGGHTAFALRCCSRTSRTLSTLRCTLG